MNLLNITEMYKMSRQDKEIILSVMVKLMDEQRPTERQREYFHAVKKHLGVVGLPTQVPNLMRCSRDVHRCLFKVITEFVCLQQDVKKGVIIRYANKATTGDPRDLGKPVFDKLRRKTRIRHYLTKQNVLSGEDVLQVLHVDVQSKSHIVHETLELYERDGSEGLINQYIDSNEKNEGLEELQRESLICSYEEWEKLQYEFLAQELLDSIYDRDYKEEEAYREELSALWKKLQKAFKEEHVTEEAATKLLEKNGIYIDLLRKEQEIKREIKELIDIDPDWQENLKRRGSNLYMKVEELQSVAEQGDDRRYQSWLDCISHGVLDEEQLWNKATEIGLIPDVEKVLRLQNELCDSSIKSDSW